MTDIEVAFDCLSHILMWLGWTFLYGRLTPVVPRAWRWLHYAILCGLAFFLVVDLFAFVLGAIQWWQT